LTSSTCPPTREKIARAVDEFLMGGSLLPRWDSARRIFAQSTISTVINNKPVLVKGKWRRMVRYE
jgi:hypothetical protein